MSGAFEKPHLLTREGSRLYRISHAEYEKQQAEALAHTELDEEVVYTANITSQRLQNNGNGLQVEASVTSIQKPITPFAVASFQLLLLNDDYRTASTHIAEIDPAGNWFITNPDNAIAVRRRQRRHIIDHVTKGYLVRHVPDDFDGLLVTHTFLTVGDTASQ